MEASVLVFHRKGGVGFQGMFVLVIPLCAVECVGTEVLCADASMPFGYNRVVFISSLVKSLSAVVVSVERSALQRLYPSLRVKLPETEFFQA